MNIKNLNMPRIQRWLLCGLVLLLPYHSMATYVIGDYISVFKVWKEAVICIMFAIFCVQVLLRLIKEKKMYIPSATEIVMLMYIFIVIYYILSSDIKFKAAYIGRIYLMPLLLVPVIRLMEINKDYISKLIKLVMVNTIIICLWGIFQCLILGDGFLMKIGYETTSKWGPVQLNDEFYISRMGNFQRLVSTFAAPNTCGIYLAIVLVIVLFAGKKLKINKMFSYFTIGLIVISLMLTFSRTAWVAAFAAILIYCVTMIKWTKKHFKYTFYTLVTAVLGALIIDGTFFAFDISMAIVHLIYNTINGTDSSAIGHINSLKKSMDIIKDNPFGVGLGRCGPRAKVFFKLPYLTESSYFLMAYEVGIPGAIIYYMIYISSIGKNIVQYIKNKDRMLLVVTSCVVIMLLGFISLPYVQDFELLVYIFIIIGLQHNQMLNRKGL